MTRTAPPRPSPLLAGLALAFTFGSLAYAGKPADPLLALVPPDAGVTLAVEDLTGHVKDVVGSPLAQGLKALPAVRRWRESDDVRNLRAAVDQVEALLGADMPTIRDGLIGEAVVLTLRLPPGGAPDSARGMLLARVPDPALLDRLVAGLNMAQLNSGELKRVGEKSHAGVSYSVREFAAEGRPAESYAKFADRVFVWSNSEEMLREALDRHAGRGQGLLADPAFREVRAGLPERPAASLFVDPRFVAAVVEAAPKPDDPAQARLLTLLGRYAPALRYAGIALEWRDGVVLHTHEVVEPSKLGPMLRRWAGPADTSPPALARVPSTTLGLASARVDAATLLAVLVRLLPESDRPNLKELRTAARGLMLGLDPLDSVVPHLGPAVLGYVERPGDGRVGRLPTVLAVRVAATSEGARAAAAVDNALRTLLALNAMDPKAAAGGMMVATRTEGDVTVTSLGGPKPFAYAVRDGRVVLSNSPDAILRAFAAEADPSAGARFAALRSKYVPDATSYALLDLRALFADADPRRAGLARRLAQSQKRSVEEVTGDLDEALALVKLFDAAYLTSAIAPGFTHVHRAFGLVARDASPAPAR